MNAVITSPAGAAVAQRVRGDEPPRPWRRGFSSRHVEGAAVAVMVRAGSKLGGQVDRKRVRDQVEQHDPDREHEYDRLDHRQVAVVDGLGQRAAEPRILEHVLDDDDAPKQPSEHDPRALDRRQQRVAQRMADDHDPRRHPLQPRHRDVFRAQHVDHRRATSRYRYGHVQQHERRDRQDQLGRVIERARPGARGPPPGRLKTTVANTITSVIAITKSGIAESTTPISSRIPVKRPPPYGGQRAQEERQAAGRSAPRAPPA